MADTPCEYPRTLLPTLTHHSSGLLWLPRTSTAPDITSNPIASNQFLLGCQPKCAESGAGKWAKVEVAIPYGHGPHF